MCIYSTILCFCIGNCVTVRNAPLEGKYFNFTKSDADAILGNYTKRSTYDIIQWRNGGPIHKSVTVTIINDQGHYDPYSVAASGDWEIGDKFCFKTGS